MIKPYKTGILLCNMGTPDHPTPSSVRAYLKKFLSDRRVVEIPKWLWQPILHAWILPIRGKQSAQLYKSIWTEQGSPLLHHSRELAITLEKKMEMPVALGMHYSHPSIENALEELKKKNVEKIFILPLYPQYSGTTTAAAFDLIASTLKKWRNLPEIHMIHDYADHPIYIQSIAETIKTTWKERGQAQRLLFSFHGIPKQYIQAGDPYRDRCYLTVEKLVTELNLAPNDYQICFQSRLGKAEWLTPYTDVMLRTLPSQGITDIQIICPGFAVDCLETLEEIAIRGKQQFLQQGGKKFHYIPALNKSDEQINILSSLYSR